MVAEHQERQPAVTNLLTHHRDRRVLAEELLEGIVRILRERIHVAHALQRPCAPEFTRVIEHGQVDALDVVGDRASYANASLSRLVSVNITRLSNWSGCVMRNFREAATTSRADAVVNCSPMAPRCPDTGASDVKSIGVKSVVAPGDTATTAALIVV